MVANRTRDIRPWSSRQGCESRTVNVRAPSMGRFGRLADPRRGEVTNHVWLGWRSDGDLSSRQLLTVRATWVASRGGGQKA